MFSDSWAGALLGAVITSAVILCALVLCVFVIEIVRALRYSADLDELDQRQSTKRTSQTFREGEK